MLRFRLGYLDPFRPFCWSEGDAARGLFVEALSARLPAGVVIDWVPGALGDLPDWLAQGKIDAIAAKAVTPGRGRAFSFSAPLLQTAAALFGPVGHPAPHPADLGDCTIATPGAGPLASILPRLAPKARVTPVADYHAALHAVETGLADWAALNADAVPALYPNCTGPAGPRWAELGLAVAVPYGDPARILSRLGLPSVQALPQGR